MNAILIAGAALVGLPILLHLIMKQEPKRLTFPAFRFLKQKLKTNQRKLRLRHFILLALRMLIIALFCLTLYQPTFKSERLNFSGEQPVATVIIIDTSPSMGYMANDKSRLEESRQRALELLNELPDKSPVAVIDTNDLTAVWLPDTAAARRRIEELKETRGGNQSVSSAIAAAYVLHAKVEKDTESPDPLQKLVAVFTDRTVGTWDASRTDDLKKLREIVPEPKPIHVVFDFGADQPTNVAILSIEMKPQVIAANQVANVVVTVGAVGAANESVEATVVARPAGVTKAESAISKPVTVRNGQTQTVAFEFRDLKPGLNQWEFGLKASDNLGFDNTRFLTFKVGAARRILTITDDKKGAAFWQAAHLVKDEFSCLVVTPDQIKFADGGQAVVEYATDPKKPNELTPDDIRNFEAVCLLAVREPNQPAGSTLWDKLRPYLRTGGKLIVIPGRDGWMTLADYNEHATDLMPGKLTKVIETKRLDPAPPQQKAPSWGDEGRDGAAGGVTWVLDAQALKHPMLKPIEDWRQQKTDRLDLIANPRRATKYWEVTPDPTATVVVRYRDTDKPNAGRPAILERPVLDPKDNNRPKGKVVLLTTRMDVTADKDEWNDYWEQLDSSWFVAFPYLLVRYLAGDTTDANFNFPTGATVTVPLPRGKLARDGVVILDGPGIVGNDATIRPGDKQTEIRLGPPKTNAAGNFALSIQQGETVVWKDGFSTNVPSDESNLDKVPLEPVEELVGEGRVIPVTKKNVTLRELLSISLGQPIDLFPWLLIAVLMALVAEGFIANRFYRRVK